MSDEIDNMLSAQPEATEEVQPEAEAETPEPEQQEAEAPEPEQAEKPEPMVPASVVKAIREDLKRQLDELRTTTQGQPQPQQARPAPPDMFQDPDAYTRHIQSETQRMILSAKADISQSMAEREFGSETVQEALAAAQANPAMVQQFLNDPHPYGKLVEWHRQQKVAQEIGSDPAAYRAKLEAEIRAKIEAEMVAKQASALAGKAPPSLAGVNGTGGKSDPGWQGPTDLDSLLGG